MNVDILFSVSVRKMHWDRNMVTVCSRRANVSALHQEASGHFESPQQAVSRQTGEKSFPQSVVERAWLSEEEEEKHLEEHSSSFTISQNRGKNLTPSWLLDPWIWTLLTTEVQGKKRFIEKSFEKQAEQNAMPRSYLAYQPSPLKCIEKHCFKGIGSCRG